MADFSGKIDLDKLIICSGDLVDILKDKRDTLAFTQTLEHSNALRSYCDSDFNSLQSSLTDCEKKINSCRQKTEEAKSEIASDAEIDSLRKELEEELKKESFCMEEIRIIANEINDLEGQRKHVQEKKQTWKRLKQDEQRAQRKLSMYASVTNIIPDLYEQSKISGHIVDREKNVVQKFEFDSTETSSFDACNNIWKMITP